MTVPTHLRHPMLNLCSPGTYLTHAVVCQLNMTLRVQQHIVQFQITVDDSWNNNNKTDLYG